MAFSWTKITGNSLIDDISSATIYSVIETAKANGLAIEKYLVYLMDVLSNLEVKDKNKDTLLKYMPWSKELPEEVHLQNKNIR